MEAKEPEPSLIKRVIDKFLKVACDEYEGVSRKAIDSIRDLYSKNFGQIPEILNLGPDYNNRLRLSVASFKIDYWIDQLSGIFYTDCERIIDIMCSYEIEKLQRGIFKKGFTDDPVHLLFYVIKQYAVKLSRTHFDNEDIREAYKWQSFLRELIINDVFPDSNEDSRLQVLFDLEATFKKSIIPKLEAANENKSALEHLQSIIAHLNKLLDISYKYLFYIGRNSEYVPNFSIRKLRLLKDLSVKEQETLCLTETEEKYLNKIKDTWPIQLLYKIFSKSDLEKDREHLSLVGVQENHEILNYSASFASATVLPNELTLLLKPFFLASGRKPDFYAHHINLRYFVNAHLLLGELSKFKELFEIAKGCAEMGGNLLTFGLLREQLVNDVQDCSKYLHAFKSICDAMEGCAWEAFRASSKSRSKEAETKTDTVSKEWKDNYRNSANTYFNSLNASYECCQTAFINLIAAATKKSTHQLFVETERVVKKYINIHTKHRSYREETLQKLNHLSSLNSFLSGYCVQEKGPGGNEYQKTFKITGDIKRDYKSIKQIKKNNETYDYQKIYQDFSRSYSDQIENFNSLYYLGRFRSFFHSQKATDGDAVGEEKYYQWTLNKQPKFFKANYRLAKIAFSEGRLAEANELVKKAMVSFSESEEASANFGTLINQKPLIKMRDLDTEINKKR